MILPENLIKNIDSLVDKSNRNSARKLSKEKALFYVFIIFKYLINRTYRYNHIEIYRDTFIALTDRYNYVLVKEYFIENGVISIVHNYSAGRNAYIFNVTKTKLFDRITDCNITYKQKLKVKVINKNNELRLNNTMKKTIELLNIDIKNTNYEDFSIKKKIMIVGFFYSRIITNFKKSKRIYHCACTLPSIVRDNLFVIEEKRKKYFNNIDIISSQPTFLIMLLRIKNLGVDESYIKDIQEGVFYESIRETLNGKYLFKTNENKKGMYFKPSRKNIKQHIFHTVLFDFYEDGNGIFSPINKAFKKLYPLTHASLKKLHNDETSKTIAAQLQDFEADLFNSLYEKSNCSSPYYFTVYDSIYFTRENDIQNIENYLIDYRYKHNLPLQWTSYINTQNTT